MRETLSLSYLIKHNSSEKNCPSVICSKGWGKPLGDAYGLKQMKIGILQISRRGKKTTWCIGKEYWPANPDVLI